MNEEIIDIDVDETLAIVLDVGGVQYKTTVGTLIAIPESVLANIVLTPLQTRAQLLHLQQSIHEGNSKQTDTLEPIFIDRDGNIFRHILNYLRNRTLPLKYMSMFDRNALLDEAKYFNLKHLSAEIARSIRLEEEQHSAKLTQEKQYRLIGSPSEFLNAAINHYTSDGWDIESLTHIDSNPTPRHLDSTTNQHHPTVFFSEQSQNTNTNTNGHTNTGGNIHMNTFGTNNHQRTRTSLLGRRLSTSTNTSTTPSGINSTTTPATNSSPTNSSLSITVNNNTPPFSVDEIYKYEQQPKSTGDGLFDVSITATSNNKLITQWYAILLSRKLSCSDLSLLDKLTSSLK